VTAASLPSPWLVLRDLDLTAIASSAGIPADAVQGLERFRSELIETLTRPV
jgi:hypothetical protein